MNKAETLIENSKNGTTIEANISFKGTMVVSGTNSVQIGGSFEGRIEAVDGCVVVQKGGTVNGSIVAANIVISGNVTKLSEDDYIEAAESLALTETAKVDSPSIRYGNMSMEFGASIRGGMTPLKTPEAAKKTSDVETAEPEPKVNVVSLGAPRSSGYFQAAEDPTVAIDEMSMSREELMAPIRVEARG